MSFSPKKVFAAFIKIMIFQLISLSSLLFGMPVGKAFEKLSAFLYGEPNFFNKPFVWYKFYELGKLAIFLSGLGIAAIIHFKYTRQLENLVHSFFKFLATEKDDEDAKLSVDAPPPAILLGQPAAAHVGAAFDLASRVGSDNTEIDPAALHLSNSNNRPSLLG